MSSWEVIYEGGKLVRRHGWVESPKVLSPFCGSKVNPDCCFESPTHVVGGFCLPEKSGTLQMEVQARHYSPTK